MDFALQKNRASMGRRYIEVFRAKKTDYYAAVCAYVADPPPPLGYHSEAGPLEGDAAVPGAQPISSGVGAGGVRAAPVTRPDVAAPQPHTGVLKMRGLPFSATKDDIAGGINGKAVVCGSSAIDISIDVDGTATSG